jgi:hypothetical protein
MTREETKSILAILKIGYPNFYKDLKKPDADQTIDLWSTIFANECSQVVVEAVKSLMCTLKFPPTIADVKEKIYFITQPAAATEMEAWGYIQRAIQDSNYHAQERFNSFPPIIQKIVGSPNQLREWAMMESDVVNSVIQSNFMRSYKAKVSAEKEYTALPHSTKLMIEGEKLLELKEGC